MTCVKHQLLVFDRSLCCKAAFKMVKTAFKSCLLLSMHCSSNNLSMGTLSICVADFKLSAVEIKSILSPLTPSQATFGEITASLDLFSKADGERGFDGDGRASNEVDVDWSQLAMALMPHVLFPAQEGYRVVIFSCDKIRIKDWVQQDNCIVLQVVTLDDFDLAGPKLFKDPTQTCQQRYVGFEEVKVAPLATEWESFFKSNIFDAALIHTVPLIVHFSTSIYSKVIISCSARPRSLVLGGQPKCALYPSGDRGSVVLETVGRYKKAGLCHSFLCGSQNFDVHARKNSKLPDADNIANEERFACAVDHMKASDCVLVLKSTPAVHNETTVRNYFVLVPNTSSSFFMAQLVPSELLLPEIPDSDPNGQETSKVTNQVVRTEVENALRRIPLQEYFDPLDCKADIINFLEKQQKKPRARTAMPAKSLSKGRGRGSRGGKRYKPLV